MALSQSRQARSLLFHLKCPVERLKFSFVEDGSRAHLSSHTALGEFEKWRKLDSRICGVANSKIPIACWTVLRGLHEKGYEAYLVGGCVRDLLLKKVPKDFDVITTAGLKQVKKKFQRAIIIGKRFPICKVTIRSSVFEVSSFDTVAKVSRRKKVKTSQMPKGCDPHDYRRWKNCLDRDFTVNSLFFDPFVNVIYDYTNGMMDLKSLRLRTVKPAHLSFKEDQARILRGLRLAARLNLSFSEETEDALYSLSSSVADLSTTRILMEMNYMLSYGAAERSLLLLKRFQLLDILLPFHAAYLSKQVQNRFGVRSLMLMKLFFNLDQLITCDQPCTESLWVAILAFHQAIFINPQHPVVVLTIASLLHHTTLEESITFAKQNAPSKRIYIPEIIGDVDDLLVDEIVKRVTQFVEQIKKSVDVFIHKKCLLGLMATFPEFPCSGLVFVPRKMGEKVKQIFDILPSCVSSVEGKDRNQGVNHRLLTEGNVNEVRFVLGMIIKKTMVHTKKLPQGTVAEAPTDDVKVKNPPHKLNIAEQTWNSSEHLWKRMRKQSTIPSDHEELSENATKKRLSKNDTTTGHRSSEIMKDESENATKKRLSKDDITGCRLSQIMKDGSENASKKRLSKDDTTTGRRLTAILKDESENASKKRLSKDDTTTGCRLTEIMKDESQNATKKRLSKGDTTTGRRSSEIMKDESENATQKRLSKDDTTTGRRLSEIMKDESENATKKRLSKDDKVE